MISERSPTNAPPTTLNREALTQQYTDLSVEYTKANQQLRSSNNEVERLRLQRQAEGILEELQRVDESLRALDKATDMAIQNQNRKHLTFEQDLQKIDFTQVKEVVRSIVSQFDRSGGSASFLLQRNLSMAGQLCLLEIKDELRRDTRDFKFYPVEFSSNSELNQVGLLKGLAGHLGIELKPDLQEMSRLIQERIVRSLQSNSIVFIEIHKWDDLPAQREVLRWFLEHFWNSLVAQLPVISNTCRRVRLIAVVVVEDELAEDCLEFCCTREKFDGQKMIDLPLQDWTVDDILDWLDYLGIPVQQSDAIAKRIHKASRGIPELICAALRKEFNR